MASPSSLAWIERLIWVLIYTGLFSFVLGLATHSRNAAIGWLLVTAGAAVAAAGGVLIWVRSRMTGTD